MIGGSPTGTGGAGGYTYNWDNGTDLDDSTIANPTANPTTNTTFIVVVTDSTGNHAFLKKSLTALHGTDPNSLAVLTDGVIRIRRGVNIGDGTSWVQLDLENIIKVSNVHVLFSYEGGNTYHDVIVQLSEDGITWTNIFNNDADNTLTKDKIKDHHAIIQLCESTKVCCYVYDSANSICYLPHL